MPVESVFRCTAVQCLAALFASDAATTVTAPAPTLALAGDPFVWQQSIPEQRQDLPTDGISTENEKLRQRNREHARNTRMRKKVLDFESNTASPTQLHQ